VGGRSTKFSLKALKRVFVYQVWIRGVWFFRWLQFFSWKIFISAITRSI